VRPSVQLPSVSGVESELGHRRIIAAAFQASTDQKTVHSVGGWTEIGSQSVSTVEHCSGVGSYTCTVTSDIGRLMTCRVQLFNSNRTHAYCGGLIGLVVVVVVVVVIIG